MKERKKIEQAEDKELVERYVNALERIEEFQDNGILPNEEEVELAEKYHGILVSIEECDVRFNEEDIEQAEKYLETLIAIIESEKKLKELRGEV